MHYRTYHSPGIKVTHYSKTICDAYQYTSIGGVFPPCEFIFVSPSKRESIKINGTSAASFVIIDSEIGSFGVQHYPPSNFLTAIIYW